MFTGFPRVRTGESVLAKSVALGEGKSIVCAYDDLDRVVLETWVSSAGVALNVIENTYDWADHLVWSNEASTPTAAVTISGAVTKGAIDSRDFIKTIRVQRNSNYAWVPKADTWTKQEFDGYGRLSASTTAAAGTRTSWRDAIGREVRVGDAKGGEWLTAYDLAGRTRLVSVAGSGRGAYATYDYYAAGPLDPGSAAVGKTDLVERVIARDLAYPGALDGPHVLIAEFAYDDVGRETDRNWWTHFPGEWVAGPRSLERLRTGYSGPRVKSESRTGRPEPSDQGVVSAGGFDHRPPTPWPRAASTTAAPESRRTTRKR